MTAQQCKATIEGPKVGKHVVLYRYQCRNRTTDESGYCYLHRERRR